MYPGMGWGDNEAYIWVIDRIVIHEEQMNNALQVSEF